MNPLIEIIGIIAGLIVLGSFLLKGERKIRSVNIFGAVVFVVYGILISSYATMLLNGGLIIVHIYYLYKRGKK